LASNSSDARHSAFGSSGSVGKSRAAWCDAVTLLIAKPIAAIRYRAHPGTSGGGQTSERPFARASTQLLEGRLTSRPEMVANASPAGGARRPAPALGLPWGGQAAGRPRRRTKAGTWKSQSGSPNLDIAPHRPGPGTGGQFAGLAFRQGPPQNPASCRPPGGGRRTLSGQYTHLDPPSASKTALRFALGAPAGQGPGLEMTGFRTRGRHFRTSSGPGRGYLPRAGAQMQN